MSEEFHDGLEDVVAAETSLSRIDGEAGELLIRGFPVEELAANAAHEETVHLLYEDALPTEAEYERLRRELAERRALPDATRSLLAAAADAGVPAMAALEMGVASLALVAEDDPGADARLVVAALPTMVAAYWRLRNGEEPVEPRTDLSHAANYLHMLAGEEPDEARVAALETYLNAICDHGLNASTFTARVVASTGSDVVSAVTGAVGALKGPLHGGAPGPVLEMLREIRERGDPEAYLREKLEAGERLMGFGHRVYRVRDPRAAAFDAAAERLYRNTEDEAFYEMAHEVEETAVDLLAEYKPGRRLRTNVEFYTAVLLDGVGVPPELFSTTFAIGRAAGWTAHYLEQRREGRLIRPRARYVGAEGRQWVPRAER